MTKILYDWKQKKDIADKPVPTKPLSDDVREWIKATYGKDVYVEYSSVGYIEIDGDNLDTSAIKAYINSKV